MKKNYYDILQVNKNASPEIIEKAYKTLAKMYHPDLQEEDNKKQAEENFKQINEAYEVLSDLEKKKNYDAFLKKEETKQFSETIPNEKYNKNTTNTVSIRELHAKLEQERLRQQRLQQQEQQKKQLQYLQEQAYQKQLQQAREQAYHDAYIQNLKNYGYTIRYKKSLKDYIKGLISIIIVLFSLFLLWHIPFIQNFILSFLEKYTFLKK